MGKICEQAVMSVVVIDSDADRCAYRMNELARDPGIGRISCGVRAHDVTRLVEEEPARVCLVSAETYPPEKFVNFSQQVKDDQPGLRLIVTDVPEDSSVILEYIEMGAWDYVIWREGAQVLREKIHASCRGQSLFDPAVVRAVIERIQELSRLHQRELSLTNGYTDLTQREKEILSLIAQRMTNREIADQLFLEVGTIKNHVHNLLNKLEVENRYEAASYCLKEFSV
jgi:DNA-binding NarL/FixJ family response regulator